MVCSVKYITNRWLNQYLILISFFAKMMTYVNNIVIYVTLHHIHNRFWQSLISLKGNRIIYLFFLTTRLFTLYLRNVLRHFIHKINFKDGRKYYHPIRMRFFFFGCILTPTGNDWKKISWGNIYILRRHFHS